MPSIATGLLFALVLPVSTLVGGDTLSQADFKGVLPPAANTSPSGSIAGRVFYRADADRPWRYARYYVKDRQNGELAEAVVALETAAVERGPSDEAVILVVDQKDFQFIPETASIRVGDRVKFLNSDSALHNVQSFHPKYSFNVNMPTGREHIETFPQAGGIDLPYRIGCIYHSGMRSWIYVFHHPYHEVTKPNGRFHLSGIPGGTYMLHMVHPAGRLRWRQSIKVEAGETTEIDIRVSPDDIPKKRP